VLRGLGMPLLTGSREMRDRETWIWVEPQTRGAVVGGRGATRAFLSPSTMPIRNAERHR